MTHITRRALIVGETAAVTLAALPAMAKRGPMPPARLFRANGINLSVHDVGTGPAGIALHWFPSPAFGWRQQIAPLVAVGHGVIVPDLRGYRARSRTGACVLPGRAVVRRGRRQA